MHRTLCLFFLVKGDTKEGVGEIKISKKVSEPAEVNKIIGMGQKGTHSLRLDSKSLSVITDLVP